MFQLFAITCRLNKKALIAQYEQLRLSGFLMDQQGACIFQLSICLITVNNKYLFIRQNSSYDSVWMCYVSINDTCIYCVFKWIGWLVNCLYFRAACK